MTCRSCGTEIADKAIICFKCGAATSDPVRQPYVAPKRSVFLVLVGWLVFLAGGLFTYWSALTDVAAQHRAGLVTYIGFAVMAAGLMMALSPVFKRRR